MDVVTLPEKRSGKNNVLPGTATACQLGNLLIFMLSSNKKLLKALLRLTYWILAASKKMKLEGAMLCKRYCVAMSIPSSTAAASRETGGFVRSALVKSFDLHVTILRSISFAG